MSFFRTKVSQREVDPCSLGEEREELDLCVRTQNYLFGVTEVRQVSSAGEMNSSPLEKEAALASSSRGHVAGGPRSSACWGHRAGKVSVQGVEVPAEMCQEIYSCLSFPCGKYLMY